MTTKAGCRLCPRDRENHGPPCRYCGRPPEHHVGDDVEQEIAGRRRMAAARQAAGSPLNDVDREVLRLPV